MDRFGTPVDGAAYWVRPGAYALIRDDRGRLAVAVVDGREWHLPGGGIDPGETAEGGLVREVQEEIGLVVVPGRLLAEIEEYSWSRREGHFIKAGRYYEAEWRGATAEPTEIDHELAWVSIEEARERVVHASQRWLLRTLP